SWRRRSSSGPCRPGANGGPGMSEAVQPAPEPWLELTSSSHFPDWLVEQRISLAFTTYQTGKLLLLGVGSEGRLKLFERTFNRCMGLWSDGQSLWLSTRYQLWRFENVLRPGQLHEQHDR